MRRTPATQHLLACLFAIGLSVVAPCVLPAGFVGLAQAEESDDASVIAETRGDLATAEKLYNEALEIDRKFGNLEGQARHLTNLCRIAGNRGDLPAAERLYNEALVIYRKLGSLELQASTLTMLGFCAHGRNDFAKARRLWIESHDLHAKLGAKPMVERVQGFLDALPPE